MMAMMAHLDWSHCGGYVPAFKCKCIGWLFTRREVQAKKRCGVVRPYKASLGVIDG
jgi:hypothetical protein